jgi:hypothetical protein
MASLPPGSTHISPTPLVTGTPTGTRTTDTNMDMSNFNGQLTKKNKSVESIHLHKILEYCILSVDVIFKLKISVLLLS